MITFYILPKKFKELSDDKVVLLTKKEYFFVEQFL